MNTNKNEVTTHDSSRRKFMAWGLSAIAALPMGKALAASCGLTPAQTRGPFYPGGTAFGTETDLTLLPGATQSAAGQVIYVTGKILDAQCKPIEGANVEIWQACASGKYNHRNDPNPAKADPHFRYWAETFTDKNGEYSFKSIIPGAYPADTGWIRPPHIHFRVSALGYRELVTQMYFKGEKLNDDDLILNALQGAERNALIVDFTPSAAGLDPGSLTGYFEITLQKVARP
ncbi:MAG: hypothetical protein JNL01_12440 [Bdellovibrionales bacterium]|nr:hypothetical protein [Bdellovibrionales bacterium]